jgi:hypothetical protein
MKRLATNNTKKSTLHSRRASRFSIHQMFMASLVVVLLLGGCNKTQPADNSSAAAPAPQASAPAPAPDAAAPTTAVAPPQAPTPVPAPAPPPVQAAAPLPPPPPPPPKVYTVPSGTAFAVTISQTISAKGSTVGDPFSGALAQSVRVGGVTLLKAGTPVSGTVIAAKGQGRFKGEGDLGIELSRVGSHEVTTKPYLKSVSGKGKRSTAMIGGGGGGGALIGGLAGGGKGALIGGLIGAGAGTAGAALTGGKDVSIPAESVVTFISTAPLSITGKAKSEE